MAVMDFCQAMYAISAMTDWPSGAPAVFQVGRLSVWADAMQNRHI